MAHGTMIAYVRSLYAGHYGRLTVPVNTTELIGSGPTIAA